LLANFTPLLVVAKATNHRTNLHTPCNIIKEFQIADRFTTFAQSDADDDFRSILGHFGQCLLGRRVIDIRSGNAEDDQT